MNVSSRRTDHLRRLYDLLATLEAAVGGKRTLTVCHGRMPWPARGVYFFFEDGEERSDTGTGPRVVRVGTHALREGSDRSLWHRLAQHRGIATTGGGNHRGSVFRLLVGTALMSRKPHLSSTTWGLGSSAGRETRHAEHDLEVLVSQTVGAMPFLWLGVPDPPGPGSLRGRIERNAIALLSNYRRSAIDPPSESWLGGSCSRPRVRESGLWNSNHVDETCDPGFLDDLEQLVRQQVCCEPLRNNDGHGIACRPDPVPPPTIPRAG